MRLIENYTILTCKMKRYRYSIDWQIPSLLMFSCLNPFTLKSFSRNIVCYFHTFGNNLGINRNFAKYFKESCCLSSDQHFSFKCFKKKCFSKENTSRIIRPLLAALSVNGLTLMLLMTNLANTKWYKKLKRNTETLTHGYSSVSTQQELSNEYQLYRVIDY